MSCASRSCCARIVLRVVSSALMILSTISSARSTSCSVSPVIYFLVIPSRIYQNVLVFFAFVLCSLPIFLRASMMDINTNIGTFHGSKFCSWSAPRVFSGTFLSDQLRVRYSLSRCWAENRFSFGVSWSQAVARDIVLAWMTVALAAAG